MEYFIVGISVILLSVEAVFDCGRPSGTDLCLVGSTCDLATGQCVCVDPLLNAGYDCGLALGFVDDPPCPATTPCNNGATCVGDGTNSICYCPDDYVGDTCDIPRYGHSCGDGMMTISVTPFGDFSEGVMYIEGDPNCTLVNEASDGRYTITLPHTGGTCIDAITSTTEDERYTRRVIILYSSIRITGRDEVLTINCGSDLLTTTSNITVGEFNQGLYEDTRGVVPQDSDVNFLITAGGSSITAGLSLGEPVTIAFSLTDMGSQRYNAFRIESCLATNNMPSDSSDYRSASFIANSCQTSELASVTSQPLQSDNTTVSFVFEAFRFRVGEGDKLVVKCVVKLCQVEADCDPVLCPGDEADSPGGLGRRRRRRDAGEERSLARVLTINNPLPDTPAEDTTLIESKSCTRTGVTIGVVIAMATIMFLLFSLCVILVLRDCYKNRKLIELDAVSQSSTTRLATRQRVL